MAQSKILDSNIHTRSLVARELIKETNKGNKIIGVVSQKKSELWRLKSGNPSLGKIRT